jgi:hypothetical protein
MRHIRLTVSSLISFLLFSIIISAQTPPPTIRIQPFISGLTSPLLATNARDGSRRLFIVQQGGIIKVVQPGSTTATDFLNITTRIVSGGERGLLGLAFHPDFRTNGYFFVNYTRTGDGATVIARYKTTDATNQLGDPNSERILLTIPQPFANHNGGMIEFRTDNGVHNLYIGMGDGGSGNDPGNRAQNINELLGKFLRITPDVSGNQTAPAYTVPADNPYAGATPGADEIYAIGLRNPFRWSFDRDGTRQLWAGDVGQSAREEVDIITLGGNFGWRIMEGTICTPGVNPNCTPPPAHIPPVFEYDRTGGRCSITGGYVYRGTRGTLPNGAYVYGDYCTGQIYIWQNNQQIQIADIANTNLSSFGEDEDGELYVCFLSQGTVQKIVASEANADFDGDFITDLSVFRQSTGTWYWVNSQNNTNSTRTFGTIGDIPAPEDYDGDNKTDVGVFRPSNGTWYFVRSGDNTFGAAQFGASGDVPVQGDYEGDGKADFAVFRPSTGVWYRLNSSNNSLTTTVFGASGDVPAPADFDGDGKVDISVYRGSTGIWYRINSFSNTITGVQWGGVGGDYPVPGDYDGDGRADVAVVRFAGSMFWYILRSSNNTAQTTNFGGNADIPVPGDYDGDGRDDIGVYQVNMGVGSWYFIRSSNGAIGGAQFGANNDLPAPAYDRP